MTALLVVPVHLDALYLAQDRYVTEPTADFTRLPYIDPATGQDVHADLPYLSEIILSKPFQDQRLQLKAGIHLNEQRGADRERIEALLDQPGIDAPQVHAHFSAQLTVREGWLKLRKLPAQT
jgi:hypothetical protein